MRPFVVVVLLASTTAHIAAQSSVSISAIDRPSAATFALVTINGNGFDAASGAIAVVFASRDAITVTVPAVTATATSVQVAVPPLISTSDRSQIGRDAMRVDRPGHGLTYCADRQISF